jgi:hypothetical protein
MIKCLSPAQARDSSNFNRHVKRAHPDYFKQKKEKATTATTKNPFELAAATGEYRF